jgi:hypothetical protein
MSKSVKKKRVRRASLKRQRWPVVLIIDDEEADARAAKDKLGTQAESICRTPNEVTLADLNRADLVLVDFRLSHWPERDNQTTPSFMPQDGIALVATLRSNLKLSAARTPKAFALISGRLADLSGELSAVHREHAIARMLDLDWVFTKGISAGDFGKEVKSLALAVAELPHPWPAFEKSRETLRSLLELGKKSRWYIRATEDLEKGNPPQDVLAQTTHGMAVVRWLLHDVLPFPCFLIDERYLAARLRVTPKSLRQVLSDPRSKRLRSAFKEFEYTGILSTFSGSRWWRAGVEHWLWGKTKGQTFDGDALKRVGQELSSRLVPLRQLNPVVTLDDNYRPTDVLIDLKRAVQISPDNWPTSADPAWVSLDKARNDPGIAARVIARDRAKLGPV